jgi:hypothetical protein
MNRSTRLARARVLVVSAALVAALGVVGAPPAAATLTITANVSGDQVVPGPGDDDAVGVASPFMRLDPEDPGAGGRACVFYETTGMDPATAAQIGSGDPGEAGTIVLTIPVDDFGDGGSGCLDGVDPALVQSFNDDPAAFFVQLVTDAFPDGAVRGPITVGAVIAVSVHKFVCPGSIRSAADLLAAPAGTCTPAARTGDFGSPPPGHTWDPKPTEFDIQVALLTAAGTLTLADADLDGGGTCGPKTCTPGRWYTWQELAPGPMTMTELTFPKGYRFGWATVGPQADGEPVPSATVDVAHHSISFDMTEFGATNGISISIYDFRGH